MKRKILSLIAILVSTVPAVTAVLLYFPIWRAKGGEYALCGLTLLLLLLSAVPFFKLFKRIFSSPSAPMMWFLIFVFFLLLSKIADEITVISFVGFISNLIGSSFIKLARGYEK